MAHHINSTGHPSENLINVSVSLGGFAYYDEGDGNYSGRYGPGAFNSPLHDFHEVFLSFYGYISVCICIFGFITNVINISVLMVKEMRTPTNTFLIALAVFDILTMLPYIPFAIHFHCPPVAPDTKPEAFSYAWVRFLSIVIQLMATTHTISLWIAVSLAAFRYSQVRSSSPRGPLAKERSIRIVKLVIFIVTLVSTLALIPNYLKQTIVQESYTSRLDNKTYYFYSLEATPGSDNTDRIMHMNVLVYGILGKIVPCIHILIFSGYLVYHMTLKNIRRRQRLSTMTQQWRTTNMLLVVLVLFILIELPQGIFIVLTMYIPGFFDNTYYYLGELFDVASLLNNAVNFILYCAMSQQFRDQFMALYVHKYWPGRSSQRLRACHSEVLTMRDGTPKATTTIITHVPEDQITVKL